MFDGFGGKERRRRARNLFGGGDGRRRRGTLNARSHQAAPGSKDNVTLIFRDNESGMTRMIQRLEIEVGANHLHAFPARELKASAKAPVTHLLL